MGALHLTLMINDIKSFNKIEMYTLDYDFSFLQNQNIIIIG